MDTNKAATADTVDTNDSGDSEYIGKHRPGRFGLLHPKVRVSKLSGREFATPTPG
jgi:hypothetical protein